MTRELITEPLKNIEGTRYKELITEDSIYSHNIDINKGQDQATFGGFKITNELATTFSDSGAGKLIGLSVKGNELGGVILVNFDTQEVGSSNVDKNKILSDLRYVNQSTNIV
ncbi:MAG: hypothetical protein WDN24_15345 [Sphingomonas sp.]